MTASLVNRVTQTKEEKGGNAFALPVVDPIMERNDNEARKPLTDKEIETLDKFHDNVKDVLKPGQDDFFLLRWLRARNYDLQKSEDMLRKSVAWRKKWKADTILTEWTPPEVMNKYFPVGMLGYDKDGCPVWIYPARNLHMKSISLAVKKSDIIRFHIHLMERCQAQFVEQSQKLGRRIDKAVLIDDLDGFTLKQLFMPGMDVVIKFMAMIEANYPETLKTGYIINGPMIFPIVYKIVKPLLSEHTKRKICILGRDWKEKLRETIDADVLPVFWGGTATDPGGDVYCQSRVCLGGEVPSEFFLKGSQLIDESKVTKVVIGRGDSLQLKFDISKAGLTLRWLFWTDNYDIKFGVGYKPSSSSKSKSVVSSERINSHQVPEDGVLECEQAGIYTVKFDNTYSWVYSKHLSYHIEVVNMDDLQSDSTSVYSSASSSSLQTPAAEAKQAGAGGAGAKGAGGAGAGVGVGGAELMAVSS